MALVSTVMNKGQLALTMEGKRDRVVPPINASADTMNVKIWKDSVVAQRVGDEVVI